MDPFNTGTPKPVDQPVPIPVQANPVQEFNKGIKRSPEDYIKLTQDKDWPDYNRHLEATAASHGLLNVLDGTYVPITVPEIKLFAAHNTFMYSVFTTTCKTLDSQKHVRAFSRTQDAQDVYQEVVFE